MIVLWLAFKSLRNRLLTTLLTVSSIALSVTLLVGVENVRAGVRESFSGTIRGTDLVVGARGGTLQVLLSSVFGIGIPGGAISHETYEKWAKHPAVAWTIPIQLGDSHRGFRVIGTDASFFKHFHFRRDSVTFAAGGAPTGGTDVVIGADVAERLKYQLGQRVVVTHGLSGIGATEHEAHPFTVTGILNRTFTPIDRALFVTLEGVAEMHAGFDLAAAPTPIAGAAPPPQGVTTMPGATPPPTLVMPGAVAPPPSAETRPHSHAPLAPGDSLDPHDLGMLNAFYVGAKNRMDALTLQREINTDFSEPLTAVIPGVALAEMWQTLGNAEVGLKIVAGFTVLIGITGMLVALYSSLEARRREMAILRAVGAKAWTIVSLLVVESAALAMIGSVIGIVLVYASIFVAQTPVERNFGVVIPIHALGAVEWTYIAVIVSAGFLVGFFPAFKAYRTSLLDGLAPRV